MFSHVFFRKTTPRKIFFFDVETTGLIPGFHEICQFAGILDVDGETVWEYEKIVRPQYPCRIDPGAVAVHGITLDKMMKGIKQDELHYHIVKHLSFSIDKYNKEDKAFPAAFNGTFDYGFLSSLFRVCNDPFMGSLLNHRIVDPLAYLRFLNSVYDWKLENMKLPTIAQAMDIKIDAHDAMSDTRALRELYYMLVKELDR